MPAPRAGMSRAGSAVLAAVAISLFVLCWSTIHHGAFARLQIKDTGLYQEYGRSIVDGKAPYRDFGLEYPPGALPAFVLPALVEKSDAIAYEHWFDRLMALCGCLAIVGATLALRAVGASSVRTATALLLIAASPLLLGSVMLSRFDWWPAAAAAFALAALLHERAVLAALAVGVAIATKLWPAVLAPLGVIWFWRTRGPRAAVAWAAGVIAVDAAIFVPFAVLSPSGLGHSFHTQLARPLQIESLGAALLIALHRVAGTSVHVVSTFGSQNVAGTGADAVALATSVAGGAALLAIWWAFARGELTRARLAAYAAGSVAALLAYGKVFSPQFMIWLIPLVPIVVGLRGAVASLLLAASLVLTQTWFPRHYWSLANELRPRESWYLLARDLTVLALAAVLVWPRLQDEPLGEGRARLEALDRVRTQVD